MSRLATRALLTNRPPLEALEDRSCPTAITFRNGALTINVYTTGTDTFNAVHILQNDDTNTRTLVYDDTSAGPHFLTATFASSEVHTIELNLGGDNDYFTYSTG